MAPPTRRLGFRLLPPSLAPLLPPLLMRCTPTTPLKGAPLYFLVSSPSGPAAVALETPPTRRLGFRLLAPSLNPVLPPFLLRCTRTTPSTVTSFQFAVSSPLGPAAAALEAPPTRRLGFHLLPPFLCPLLPPLLM